MASKPRSTCVSEDEVIPTQFRQILSGCPLPEGKFLGKYLIPRELTGTHQDARVRLLDRGNAIHAEILYPLGGELDFLANLDRDNALFTHTGDYKVAGGGVHDWKIR